MKTSTKVTIGLSIATVATVATAVVISGVAIEKVRHLSNRIKVKRFVNDKFDGNQKLLEVVDHLSDNDLDTMMNALGKIKDGRKKISVYGNNIKNSTESLKDQLLNFVDSMM